MTPAAIAKLLRSAIADDEREAARLARSTWDHERKRAPYMRGRAKLRAGDRHGAAKEFRARLRKDAADVSSAAGLRLATSELSLAERALLWEQLTETPQSTPRPKSKQEVALEACEPRALVRAEGDFAKLAAGPRTGFWHPQGDAQKVDGHLGICRVHALRGQHTLALIEARRAIELGPGDLRPHVLMIDSMQALGLGAKARAEARKLSARAPIEPLRVLGVDFDDVAARLGTPRQARVAYVEGLGHADARAWTDAARAFARAASALSKRSPNAARADVLRRWAHALACSGEVDAAARVAKQAARCDEDDVSVWELLAWTQARLGKTRVAQRWFDRAGTSVRFGGSPFPQRRRLAAFAKRDAERELNPNREGAIARATELVHFGAFAEAVEVYRTLDLAKDSPERFLAAWAARAAKQPKVALAWLRPFLRSFAAKADYAQPLDAWHLALELEVDHGAPSSALKTFRAFRRIFDKYDASAGRARGYLLAHCLELGAKLEAEHGDLEVGALALAEAQRYCPGGAEQDALHRSRALETRAFALEKKQPKESLRLYREAIALVPSAATCGNLANDLEWTGRTGAATEWFEIGLRVLADLEPELRRGWFLSKLAWALHRRRDFAGAALVSERAAALTGLPDAFHTWAASLEALGDRERAELLARRALRERRTAAHEISPLVDLLTARRLATPRKSGHSATNGG